MVTKDQIIKFKSSADMLYNSKDYTSATILYFKTWFALQDYILLEKVGQSPKDHGERFRLLEKNFPESYLELDKEFSTYRDTYSKILGLDVCTRIKRKIENELKHYQII
jgi:hypothetical protein